MMQLLTPDDPIFADEYDDPACRECGCTHHDPCVTDKGPCFWIATNFCSACARELGMMPEEKSS